MRVMTTVSLIALIGTGTLLGGCATKESVEHAQSTADLAESDATAAKGAAGRAQSTADGAAKSAQDAMASAQMANDKVDKLIADMQRNKQHTAARHHRRHVASNMSTQMASCPPANQQKTELKKQGRQASASQHALQLKDPPEKTARN